MLSAAQNVNQISPANEKLYHQSQLLGDWTGNFTKNHQKVEFKVVSIQGSTAHVEYTHNGHTDRGTASVSKNTITFEGVTMGTKDGKKGAFEFSAGTVQLTGTLIKATSNSTTPTSNLVGTWSGVSKITGEAVSLTVKSVTGDKAQISYIIDGIKNAGTASVYKNIVTFGKIQIAINDDKSAKVTYTKGSRTLGLPVAPVKANPATSTTSIFA